MTKIHKHMPFEERFWRQVEKGTDCWNWIGAKSEGYGLITVHGRSRRATHAAWYIAHGEWPNLFVCHKCDNPSCVRADHLFIGTAADNAQDAIAKGRRFGWQPRNQRGEKNGAAKLTAADVAAIAASADKSSDLASRYGVGKTTIHRVRRGEWGQPKV